MVMKSSKSSQFQAGESCLFRMQDYKVAGHPKVLYLRIECSKFGLSSRMKLMYGNFCLAVSL